MEKRLSPVSDDLRRFGNSFMEQTEDAHCIIVGAAILALAVRARRLEEVAFAMLMEECQDSPSFNEYRNELMMLGVCDD